MMIDTIRNDFQAALRKRDVLTVSTLRLLLSAIHNKEIEINKKEPLTDEEVMAVVTKEVKQRKESIESYQKSQRTDLVDKETKEMSLLGKYLPQQMKAEELEKIVKETIAEINAKGLSNFGKVMGAVMTKIKGQADGNQVVEVVKSQLN